MAFDHDLAVCIGRFQLLHNAQLHLIRTSLAVAPRCVVILGSAFQARTPKNPFNWQERAEMIRLALPEADRDRVQFAPVRDYYDDTRWVAEVRAAVAGGVSTARDRVVLVGHAKDATSGYLADFPGWDVHDVGSQGDLHAKALRAALFAGDSLEASLAAIATQVPATTLSFVRSWAQLPCFSALQQEWQDLADERAKWAASPYPPVFVTVDAVVRIGQHVLLIRRGRSPGKGLLALPGGFLEQRETVYQSAVRELQEETGLKLLPSEMSASLKAVRVFDHPDRSLRGRVITHAHYFDLGSRKQPEIVGSDDAAEAAWHPIATLGEMEEQFHDDHFHILDFFLGLTEQRR